MAGVHSHLTAWMWIWLSQEPCEPSNPLRGLHILSIGWGVCVYTRVMCVYTRVMCASEHLEDYGL